MLTHDGQKSVREQSSESGLPLLSQSRRRRMRWKGTKLTGTGGEEKRKERRSNRQTDCRRTTNCTGKR